MYRFDPTRQGNAEKMLVQPPYKPLWFFRAGSLLEFPPAVAYGRLYFANAKGVLPPSRRGACGRSGPTAPTAARPPRRRWTTTPST